MKTREDNMNLQPPEPYNKNTGEILDFHSMWHTIQGEGPFTGSPAIFIRLAGCNLQCPGCDTEYTQHRRLLKLADIRRALIDLMEAHPSTSLVVLTGGEPTRQDIGPLCLEIVRLGMHVQLESNGVLSPPKLFLDIQSTGQATYVVSPKTSHICPETKFADAFKYVIQAESVSDQDGLPIRALEHKASPTVARPPQGYDGDIYINPMNEHDSDKNHQNLMAARDSALRYGYIVGVQLHLLLQLP